MQPMQRWLEVQQRKLRKVVHAAELVRSSADIKSLKQAAHSAGEAAWHQDFQTYVDVQKQRQDLRRAERMPQ
eukprot:6659822-Prorocentrum_lima.AAC.1